MPKIKSKDDKASQGINQIDDFLTDLDEHDPMSPAEPEKKMEDNPEKDVDPGTGVEQEDKQEKEPEEEETEELEEEDETTDDEVEFDPDVVEQSVEADELPTQNRAGIINFIKQNKLNVRVTKGQEDSTIADAIRGAQTAQASDPDKMIEFLNKYMGKAEQDQDKKSENLMSDLIGSDKQQEEQVQTQPELLQIPTNFVPEITDDMFNKAISSKEGLSNVLQSFGNSIVQNVLPVQQQQFAQKLVPAFQNYMVNALALQSTVSDFYADHPYLKPVKKLVSTMAGSMHSENPNKSYQEILIDVAKQIDEKIGLKERFDEKTKPKMADKNKPKASFASAGNSNRPSVRRKKKKLDSQEEQLLDILNPRDDPFEGRT